MTPTLIGRKAKAILLKKIAQHSTSPAAPRRGSLHERNAGVTLHTRQLLYSGKKQFDCNEILNVCVTTYATAVTRNICVFDILFVECRCAWNMGYCGGLLLHEFGCCMAFCISREKVKRPPVHRSSNEKKHETQGTDEEVEAEAEADAGRSGRHPITPGVLRRVAPVT